MSNPLTLTSGTYSRIDEFLRIASTAVTKAQEESRKQGVPNVYSINGRLYFELPSGELSMVDPYEDGPNGR